MSTHWIGGHWTEEFVSGQSGFLVSVGGRLELRDRPAHTNSSHEPRLRGWCGSWNNVDTDALGLAVVTRVAKNGRAQVRTLQGEDEAKALEALGWPDLAP